MVTSGTPPGCWLSACITRQHPHPWRLTWLSCTNVEPVLMPSVPKGTCGLGLALPKIAFWKASCLGPPSLPPTPTPLVLLGGQCRSQGLALGCLCRMGLSSAGCQHWHTWPRGTESRRSREGPFPRGPVHLCSFSWETYRGGRWLPEPQQVYILASDGNIRRGRSATSQGQVLTVCDSR